MKGLSLVIAAALAVGVLMSGKSVAQQPNEMTREERAAAVVEAAKKLDWKYGPESIAVKPLNGTIELDDGEILTQGKDAEEYVRLIHGQSVLNPDAVVVTLKGPFEKTAVIYHYVDTGHIKTIDWKKVIQPDAILANIKKNTEEDNKNRPPGFSKSYVDGWVEEPYIDRENGVAYWAVKSRTDKDDQVINAKALKLGRTGFASLYWIGSADRFVSTQQNLRPAVEAYRIKQGYRHADFKPGTDEDADSNVAKRILDLITGASPGH